MQNVLLYLFYANMKTYSTSTQYFVVINMVNYVGFKKNKQNLHRIDDPTVALATVA